MAGNLILMVGASKSARVLHHVVPEGGFDGLNQWGTPRGTVTTSPLPMVCSRRPAAFAADFSVADRAAWLDDLAAGNERGAAVKHVEDVRVIQVHFRFARSVASAGIHAITGVAHEVGIGAKSFGDLVVRHVAHLCCCALSNAAAPALAISSSWAALAAPLTPMAPTTLPPTVMGTPPCSGVKGHRRHGEHGVASLVHGVLERACRLAEQTAVRALPMEISDAFRNVLSRRSR